MRAHPFVGTLFLLLGGSLLFAGATASSAPSFFRRLPVPPEVAVPFILWQLAVWALLFGWFFIRPRHRRRSRDESARRALARI